jgi:hypothetical protein
MNQRQQVSVYTNWLRTIPWQLFVTLTFAWRVADAQAEQVFTTFVDRLERHFRCPLVYVRGDERRFSGCGMPAIRRHFHALFAAAVPLARAVVHDTWIEMAGSGKNQAGADVRIYDPKRGALSYSLKTIFDADGDWSMDNLDLYLRNPSKQSNARDRRRRARHAKRVLLSNTGLRVMSSF